MHLYVCIFVLCILGLYVCDIEQTSDCTRLCTSSIVLYQCTMCLSKGVLLQRHTARLIGDCNHWILRQTSLLH